MIVKAGFAAVVVITAFVSGRSIDLRELYDQMYPVSTLKRDALNLCHESDPTFVRAVHGDRQACYTGMPHAIALALGLVRPDSALAGLFSPWGLALGTGAALADSSLGSWAASTRQPPLTSRLAVKARAGLPCGDEAAGLAELPAGAISTATALDVLAGHHGTVGDISLMKLGPAPHAATPPQPSRADRLTLLDTTIATDLGDIAGSPTHQASGCSTKI